MPNRSALATLCVVCLTLVTRPEVARADGKFFRLTGAELEPTIPFQRAVISYRDGVETLIVESAVRDGGREVGWVLPLPAEPTEVASCKPHTLTAAFQLIGPRIERNAGHILNVSALGFFLLLLLCAVRADIHARPQASFGAFLERCVVLGVGLLLLAPLYLPLLGWDLISGGAGGRDLDLTLHREHRAGLYDIAVIAAATADPIQSWLTQNGYHVPEAAKPVLADYVERGWCFAAVRVRADAEEIEAPHPLRFVFPAERAVYPMKLTGVGAEPMQLDLYVVGHQTAVVPYLRRVSCDRYSTREVTQTLLDFIPPQTATYYEARSVDLAIGHPDIVPVMWDGCTLTHLRGVLQPRDMNEDYSIIWDDAAADRQLVYSRSVAREFGFAGAWLVGGLGLVLTTVVWVHSKHRRDRRACWTLAVSAASALACVWLIPAVLPTADAVSSMWSKTPDRAELAYGVLYDQPPAQPDGTDFREVWKQALAREARVYTTDEIDVEPADIPGGYDIEPAPHGWTLTIYERYAVPHHIPIGRDCRLLTTPPTDIQPGTN